MRVLLQEREQFVEPQRQEIFAHADAPDDLHFFFAQTLPARLPAPRAGAGHAAGNARLRR